MGNQQNLFVFEGGDARATFSRCRRYRYELRRRWGNGVSFVNFIGLNPSTADETIDDPTIRKCRKFAKTWGYDGLIMTNIFAFRATDPMVMKKETDPIGPENNRWLKKAAGEAHLVIAAWSCTHSDFLNRNQDVTELLGRRLHCLKQNAAGQPWHPLYLPDSTKPIPFIFGK